MSNLEGLNYFGDATLDDQITQNLFNFVSYGLLQLGAYKNITQGQLDARGQDVSRLEAAVYQTGVANYKVYKGKSDQWVWENDISLKFTSPTGWSQPIRISGIYVNNTFYPTGSTSIGGGYYIDYARGQVVFNSGIASSSVVQCPRTERSVHLYSAESSEYRLFNMDWNNLTNGSGIVIGKDNAYLPAIFLRVYDYRTTKGVQLGDRYKWTTANLEFTVVAANAYEVKKITDILYMMESKGFKFYNINNAPKPLSYSGTLVAPSAIWPINSTTYQMGMAQFKEDARIAKITQDNTPIFVTRVRIGLELQTNPF